MSLGVDPGKTLNNVIRLKLSHMCTDDLTVLTLHMTIKGKSQEIGSTYHPYCSLELSPSWEMEGTWRKLCVETEQYL